MMMIIHFILFFRADSLDLRNRGGELRWLCDDLNQGGVDLLLLRMVIIGRVMVVLDWDDWSGWEAKTKGFQRERERVRGSTVE